MNINRIAWVGLFAALFLVAGCLGGAGRGEAPEGGTESGETAAPQEGAEAGEGEAPAEEGGEEGAEPPAEEPAEQPAEEPAAAADGADSPEGVIDGLKKIMWQDEDMVGTLDFVVPGDRPLMVFGVDMFMGFIFMGMDEQKKAEAEKELEAIHKKHNIPEKKEGEDEEPLDPRDQEKLIAFARELYKDTDLKAYFKDILDFMKKHSDKKQKVGAKGTALKDVKAEGDKATGTLEFEDGTSKDVEFLKIEGRWYITLKSLQK